MKILRRIRPAGYHTSAHKRELFPYVLSELVISVVVVHLKYKVKLLFRTSLVMYALKNKMPFSCCLSMKATKILLRRHK